MIFLVEPVINYQTRLFCKYPYPGHPQGCPNYNRKEGCPPRAPFFDQAYNLDREIYAVVNQFDLRPHIAKMRTRHPHWTEKQLKNLLYWQPKARKELKEKIVQFLKENRHFHVETVPEAMGVDVMPLCSRPGSIFNFLCKRTHTK
jgi:hypothetical protein